MLRLMPLSDGDQTCLDFHLKTSPSAHTFFYDVPTGRVHHFNLRSPHRELCIHAESLVVTHRNDPFASLQLLSDDGEYYRSDDIRQRYYEYLTPTERLPLHEDVGRIAAVARRQAGPGTASFLISLTKMLYRVFTYEPGATNVNTPLSQFLEHKRGVCQDFAHLMLVICRREGIPARYISGYLFTGQRQPEAVSPAATFVHSEHEGYDQEQTEIHGSLPESGLVSGDAMHAWVECLLPDGQWHGFDPTNNLLTNDAYVKVHFGRDYGDVLPVRGLYRGQGIHNLDVMVTVTADRLAS